MNKVEIKTDILVEVTGDITINVKINNPQKHLKDIEAIKGVANAFVDITNSILIICNEQHEVNEVAQEIENLLMVKTFDVFK